MRSRVTPEFRDRPTRWQPIPTGRERRWRSLNTNLVVIEVRSDYGHARYFLLARTGAAGEYQVSRHRKRTGALAAARKLTMAIVVAISIITAVTGCVTLPRARVGLVATVADQVEVTADLEY